MTIAKTVFGIISRILLSLINTSPPALRQVGGVSGLTFTLEELYTVSVEGEYGVFVCL